MPRRPNQYIELDGPLFDPNVIANFKGAVSDGLGELAQDGAEILQSYIYQAGFIDSGHFVSDVEVVKVQTRGIGYYKVAPFHQWPAKGRPPRIWVERGTRRGVKLRPGRTPFAKTRTRLRQRGLGEIASRITKVIN